MLPVAKQKSFVELYEEFECYGYITPLCPECGEETEPTEVDAGEAWCDCCNKAVKAPMLC